MTIKPRIHYHSDCYFFGGCENMLANFFNSNTMQQRFDISFSYRQTSLYNKGLKARLHSPIHQFPLRFPDLTDLDLLPAALPMLMRRIILALLRLMLNWPLLAWQVLVITLLLRRLRPDLLHINNGGYPAALSARAAALAGRLAGVPCVLMVVNNMAVDYRPYYRWLDYPVDRLVRRAVNCFVTGSQAAGHQLARVLQLAPQRQVAIHNGIALRPLQAKREATRHRLGLAPYTVAIGVVALLIPRKGHKVLLKALAQLIQDTDLEVGSLMVLLEGHGPLESNLRALVQELGLSPWVSFVGVEEQVIDFMDAMDVMALPSVQDEDFPNVVLEAMALGKPVIASRLAGTPEQVQDGKTGILFEPGDSYALAKALLHLVRDSHGRACMGEAAKTRFSSLFTVETSIQKYVEMYYEIIGVKIESI